MESKTKTFFFALVIIGFIVALKSSFSFAQAQQKKFIYNPGDRRDPFISLLDKDSSTGLRTIFKPSKAKVKVKPPLKIKVTGILRTGEEFFAIINDKVMKKGQNLGEIKIKEIKKDRVIVEYGEREFTEFLKKEKQK